MNETVRKAAILVSALEANTADALLERMSPALARRVRDAVMDLYEVSSAEEETVVADFLRTGGPPSIPATDGVEVDPALLQRIAAAGTSSVAKPAASPPFRFLQDATPASLARHLAHQHPQVISVVMAHLPPRQAADVLRRLQPSLQATVLRRVAELDSADPTVLQELEQQLEALLSDEIRASKNRLRGVAAVTSILSASDQHARELLDNLSQHDQSLAELVQEQVRTAGVPSGSDSETSTNRSSSRRARSGISESAQRAASGRPTERHVKPNIDENSPPKSIHRPPEEHSGTKKGPTITFDQLAQLVDRELAHVFSHVPADVTLLSLAGAKPTFVNRLLAQLSTGEAHALQRRIERVGPVRVGDIEQAQRHVARTAQKLMEEREIGAIRHDRFAAAA